MMTSLSAAVFGVSPVPPTQPQPQEMVSTGEGILFMVVAPLIVLAALGLLFAKKAVHAALCTAGVMVCLAVLYAAQGAQFLFAAQIVVYTGAVMMLFLFVLMLVGVDRDDSLRETIGSHRLTTGIGGLGLATLLIGMIMGIGGGFLGFETLPPLQYLGVENDPETSNATGVARLVFSQFVIAFELVGTLLISAAIGAIVLTHKERLGRRVTQKELQAMRVKSGKFVAGLPAPGVFAQHNSVDTPALLPDGSLSEASVSRVLRARGQNRSADNLGDEMSAKMEDLAVEDGSSTTRSDGTDSPAVEGN